MIRGAPPQQQVATIKRKDIVNSREMGRGERRARLKREWESRDGVQVNPPNGPWVLRSELALAERAMKAPVEVSIETGVVMEAEEAASSGEPETLSFF